METKNGSKLLGRRRTLQLLGAGIAASGLLGLAACKQNGGSPSGDTKGGAGGQDCNSTIDDASRNLRRVLQYNDKAAVPEKHCSACVQYDATKYGTCGGGCKLFAGPVNPNGGCLSFAPRGADSGAAKPT